MGAEAPVGLFQSRCQRAETVEPRGGVVSMPLKIVMWSDASIPPDAEKCMKSASTRIKRLETQREIFFSGRLRCAIMVVLTYALTLP